MWTDNECINRDVFSTRWHMAASNLSWFNSALNPIIYAILNPNFRKEYLRLIKTCKTNGKAKLLMIRSSLRQCVRSLMLQFKEEEMHQHEMGTRKL